MHAKPDLRVVLKWMIARSGSVISTVLRTVARRKNEQDFFAFAYRYFVLANR